MQYTVIEPPEGGPVELAELKAALRIDVDELDEDLQALMAAAVEMAQHETGLFLMRQTVRVSLTAWPLPLVLERGPVNDLLAVEYLAGGAWRAMPVNGWVLYRDGTRWRIDPATAWPAPDPVPGVTVRIDMTVGYEGRDQVPASIKRWIIAQVGQWYANPEASLAPMVMKQSPFLDALLQPHRIY